LALAREEMRERELLDLLVRSLGELLFAIAERCAPQTRHALDVLIAVVVPEVDALGARQNERSALVEGTQIRIGMKQPLEIKRFQVRHGTSSAIDRRS